MIDRIIEKLVNVPVVKNSIDKAISSSVAVQPASQVQETKPSRIRSVVANDEQLYATDRDVDTQIAKSDLNTYLKLYQSILWAFKGVNCIASNGAMIPMKVWEYTSPTEQQEFTIHPVYKLWRNPNNLSTCNELLFQTLAYLDLAGNAYWFIERDESGLPVKLHVPRPDRIKSEVEDRQDRLLYERVKVSGPPEYWSMKDVVHFTFFNPLSDYQGFPTIGAMSDISIIDLYLLLYGKTWFKNAIYPSQMFQSSTRLSDATFERFHAQMKKLHAGYQNWGKVILLEEDLSPIDDHAKNPADSNYLDSRKNSGIEILFGLGCYHLVALLQGRSGADLREAKGMFWEETMMSRLTNVQETISKELLWSNYPESEELVVQFDARKIRGLREDALEESLSYYRYWQMGVYTPNDIRRELGADGNVEWGDERPPTMPTARSKTLPNEERGFLEDAMQHPERYPEAEESTAEKMLSRLDSAASEIAYELNKELSDSSNGDRNISHQVIKDCLLREWKSHWL